MTEGRGGVVGGECSPSTVDRGASRVVNKTGIHIGWTLITTIEGE